MFLNLEMADFSPQTRAIASDREGKKYTMATLGGGSYLVNGILETEKDDAHLLIGKYSSLGHRLKFIIGLNHDYHKVSNYPFKNVAAIRAGERYADYEDDSKMNPQQIIIGSDVHIGADVTIMGGVHIGNGAVIGANAVVAKEVPPYAIVVGNPARVIKYRFSAEVITKLQAIRWWEWPADIIEARTAEFADVESFIAKYYKAREKHELTTAQQELAALRADGYKIYYYIADFELGMNALWDKVLNSYLNSCTADDKAVLIFDLTESQLASKEFSQLKAMVNAKGAVAPMVLTHIEKAKPYELAAEIDTFISNKLEVCLKYIDRLNPAAEVRYAVDYNIFSAMEQGNYLSFKEKVAAFIDKSKTAINKKIIALDNEGALEGMAKLADTLYFFNQCYTDSELEKDLLTIGNSLADIALKADYQARENTVLFYDSFGLDIRGLAVIYLTALKKLGYSIVYLTNRRSEGNIPTLEKILAGNTICYFEALTYKSWCQEIVESVNRFKPKYAFLYTAPNDVSGLIAFQKLSGRVKRYQINLTDHAFWLGVNAFDKCLEFRDYGYTLSCKHRGIARDKLLIQPIYPYIDYTKKFEGFPFAKQNGDFVIFSGGFIYKTLDENLTYYKILDKVLAAHKNVKFWYAGYGKDIEFAPLKELAQKYAGQVYLTRERQDLYQVLENVDMYLDTFPATGGLTVQCSALAGKPPFGLNIYNNKNNDTTSMIIMSHYDFIASSVEKLLELIEARINGRNFSDDYIKELKNSVISPERFAANLKNILENDTSNYHGNIIDIEPTLYIEQANDLARFKKNYQELINDNR